MIELYNQELTEFLRDACELPRAASSRLPSTLNLPDTNSQNQQVISPYARNRSYEIYIASGTHRSVYDSYAHRDSRDDFILNAVLSSQLFVGAKPVYRTQQPAPTTQYFVSSSAIIKLSKGFWGLPTTKKAIVIITGSLFKNIRTETRSAAAFIYNLFLAQCAAKQPNISFALLSNDPRLVSEFTTRANQSTRGVIFQTIDPRDPSAENLLRNFIDWCDHNSPAHPFSNDIRFFDCLIASKSPYGLLYLGNKYLGEVHDPRRQTLISHYPNQNLFISQAPMSIKLFQAICQCVGLKLKVSSDPDELKALKAIAPNLVVLLKLFAQQRSASSANEAAFMTMPKTLGFVDAQTFKDTIRDCPMLAEIQEELEYVEAQGLSLSDPSLQGTLFLFTKQVFSILAALHLDVLNALSILQRYTPLYVIKSFNSINDAKSIISSVLEPYANQSNLGYFMLSQIQQASLGTGVVVPQSRHASQSETLSQEPPILTTTTKLDSTDLEIGQTYPTPMGVLNISKAHKNIVLEHNLAIDHATLPKITDSAMGTNPYPTSPSHIPQIAPNSLDTSPHAILFGDFAGAATSAIEARTMLDAFRKKTSSADPFRYNKFLSFLNENLSMYSFFFGRYHS